MAYVKAQTVADHFGVNKQSIYVWAREGKIPCYRLGKSLRFVIEEVEDAIKYNTHEEKSECN